MFLGADLSTGRQEGSFVCWTPLDMIWGFLVCPSPDLPLGHGGSLWTAAKYVVKSLAVQDFAWNVTKHFERWNSSLLTEFTNFWCWILCVYLGVKDFGLDSKGHSYVPKYNCTAIIQNLKIKHVPRCCAGSWPVLQKKRKPRMIGDETYAPRLREVKVFWIISHFFLFKSSISIAQMYPTWTPLIC